MISVLILVVGACRCRAPDPTPPISKDHFLRKIASYSLLNLEILAQEEGRHPWRIDPTPWPERWWRPRDKVPRDLPDG